MPRFSSTRMISVGVAATVLAGCNSSPKHAAWTYEGATGPEHWGSLSPEYALCGTGKKQSPIDIGATTSKDIPNVEFDYQPVAVEIMNNGKTIQVNYAPGSSIDLDGTNYKLEQFHFHSPSEHRVGGKAAKAEMHLVHKAASGAVAVVGVFIEEAGHNANFDPVWKHLPAKPGEAHKVHATIDADSLLPADQRTYRYDGSFTTPPGTEGVKWVIMVEPVGMSREQIEAFRRIISDNNRPTQALNGRVVTKDSSR